MLSASSLGGCCCNCLPLKCFNASSEFYWPEIPDLPIPLTKLHPRRQVLAYHLPQGDLPTVHSHYTHRSSGALPEGLLAGLPSVSLTTKGSWIHLQGEGRQASHQLSDTSTSQQEISKCLYYYYYYCYYMLQHQLMPISCHFQNRKVLLIISNVPQNLVCSSDIKMRA